MTPFQHAPSPLAGEGRERGPAASAAERRPSVSAEIALKGFESFRSNPSPGLSGYPLPQGARGFSFALLLLATITATPAHAGNVTSSEVKAVSVTLYRDPKRGRNEIDVEDLGGYALITETRTINIPAGESNIRFEGVAEGMFPETAIITGLPGGVREKNRDARLISPAGLVDAYLKRSVHLKRTNRQTGKVTEQDAILRAGPYGGVVLETSEGVEALGCSGLPERMLFDGVPDGLAAKPTLSVQTVSERAVTVTVQLSYIAQGFDWSANYVAEINEDGKTLDLFAWATIANGGAQSFVAANAQAVAGEPNKEDNAELPSAPSPTLKLKCWPLDITSTHPRQYLYNVPPPAPMAARMSARGDESDVAAEEGDTLVVTGSLVATQEELGDFKLYRIPEPVTIAAQSQKQVAMLQKSGVKFDRIYTTDLFSYDDDPRPVPFLLRMKNVKDKGLGLPMPAGRVALFEPVNGAMLLVGEEGIRDRAIGDDVELYVGESPDVQLSVKQVSARGEKERFALTLTNARPVPIMAEIRIEYELANIPKGLVRKNGDWLWRTTVPANGEARLGYKLRVERPR